MTPTPPTSTAGVDPAALKARLATAKSGILTTDAAKEEAHDTAQAATRTADDAEQRGYDTVTSVIDTAAGGLGKKTSDGKRILELRATANKERKRTRPAPAPAPTP